MSGVSELEELLAKQAIYEQMCNYTRSLDRMDRELASTVWHPDCTVDYPGFFVGPAEGLLDFLWQMHSGLLGHAHHVTNHLIELQDADHATAESYTIVFLRAPGVDGQNLVNLLSVRYADRWSRRDGRWAMAHRLGVADSASLIAGPALPGFDVANELVARDRSDPSYEALPGH